MTRTTDTDWWRSAVIYQIYPRSYADGNGDGIGDLAGIRDRLSHLRALGVDAVWLSPWYVSPMADAGYDIADYRDIDPVFGTLAEAESLIAEAEAQGLKIIVDMVPNHCSDRHPWFRAALEAGPGSPERQRFHFRPGRGEQGDLPPNNWQSHFGGPAWTQVADGEWYLHMFAPQQPDWNWQHPHVKAEFESVLRFWLDRGVAGFRIDVADHLVKAAGLPETTMLPAGAVRPWRDQEGVHDIYRRWRRILDEYPGHRVFVAELWDDDPDRFSRYLRPDELHSAFNFPLLQSPWDADALRNVVDTTLAAHARVGAPATWVLSNHDTTRHVTRYGRTDTSYALDGRRVHHAPVDLDLGTRRARAAALLNLALPGSAYIYQGEELGLWEVEDIPLNLRQDPALRQSGGTDPGRDGCRVPLPWADEAPPFAFSPPSTGTEPWLPQPPAWKDHTVAAQDNDPGSMLELYRTALRIRTGHPDLGDGTLAWLPAPEGVLAFTRSSAFACVVNLSSQPEPLPAHTRQLLTSVPLDDGMLPTDAAAWLELL
ncbi:glycoside hydrolase family 13 protein [Streptomyces sp. NPDC090032]|uniref:glycoside hydrolase family 13 protein n=1 Tax=unclassified Streptomyces TaxID=2593676 RepID=UPI00370FB191